jgi:dethiobiotin synthetase
MTASFFITGTDTSVGKTCVAAALLCLARQSGKKTAAVKPVAAGCESSAEGLRNEDALALWRECTVPLSYEQINPVALAPAIAPHIAAEQAGKRLSISRLAGVCRGVMISEAEFVVIEGAGGWRVPVSPSEMLSDLAKELNLPVIVVIGLKLGCLNHALLTVEAIKRDGLHIAAWVANQIDAEMACYKENLLALERLIPAPCLGQVPYLQSPSPAVVANYLDISKLSQ